MKQSIFTPVLLFLCIFFLTSPEYSYGQSKLRDAFAMTAGPGNGIGFRDMMVQEDLAIVLADIPGVNIYFGQAKDLSNYQQVSNPEDSNASFTNTLVAIRGITDGTPQIAWSRRTTLTVANFISGIGDGEFIHWGNDLLGNTRIEIWNENAEVLRSFTLPVGDGERTATNLLYNEDNFYLSGNFAGNISLTSNEPGSNPNSLLEERLLGSGMDELIVNDILSTSNAWIGAYSGSIEEPSLDWTIPIGTGSSDPTVFPFLQIHEMDRDNSGNIYINATYEGDAWLAFEDEVISLTADPIDMPNTPLSSKSFLMSVNPEGKLNWLRDFRRGNFFSNTAIRMADDVDNNLDGAIVSGIRGEGVEFFGGITETKSFSMALVNSQTGEAEAITQIPSGSGLLDALYSSVSGDQFISSGLVSGKVFLNDEKTEELRADNFGDGYNFGYTFKNTFALQYKQEFKGSDIDYAAKHSIIKRPEGNFNSLLVAGQYTEEISFEELALMLPDLNENRFAPDLFLAFVDFVSDNTTSTNEAQGLFPITLYPNPASEEIHLDWQQGPAKTEYSILNIEGRQVQDGIWQNGKAIQLESFAPGRYWLRVKHGKATFSRAFEKID